MTTIPLFKSHYSIGKSILTLENSDGSEESGPDSIIKICKDNSIKELVLVEDCMSGFLQSYVNCLENNIELKFGLRLTFCADMSKKDIESQDTNHKLIIFARNKNGYKRLIKISSKASCEGYYNGPRLDLKCLQEEWNDEDLILAVPFYDSFLYENSLNHKNCQVNFDFTKPIFFLEDNDMPFDYLLKSRVEDYCENDYEIQKVKSIYYKNRSDFKAYITFKCLTNFKGGAKKNLNKPNFDHMCSEEFSFESWLENEK